MADAGPVDLNRGQRSVVELPTGEVEWHAGAPRSYGKGASGPVEYNRGERGPSQDQGQPTPPHLPFAHERVGWFRRLVLNVSGGFYGAPTTPPNWTLNRPLTGGKVTRPSSAIPVSSRWVDRTYRREFHGAGIRYPANSADTCMAYIGALQVTGARMKQLELSKGRPRMTGRKPNNLTVLAPATSYGMQTAAFYGTSPYESSGPYG